MNITKFLINNNQIDFIKKTYSEYKENSNNPNVDLLFNINNTKITIYKNKSCTVSGINSDIILNNIFSVVKFEYPKNIIGMDEVGVGDYFGGLVTCSTYINKNIFEQIKTFGVCDSKLLNDNQIKNIAEKLIKIVPYSISQIYANEYNHLYSLYKNTHILKTLLHNNSLNNLIKNNKLSLSNIEITLDQYVSEQQYYKYLEQAKCNNILKINNFVMHAESTNIAVACSSIIARYYFLKQIEIIENKLNIKIPLGSWNKKIEEISKLIIKNYDPEELEKYVKLHFQNTNKILKL